MAISEHITFASIIGMLEDQNQVKAPAAGDDNETIAPEDILQFLARLRMLQGVPFNTIVPDQELLPNESIRFFFLDRAWTDALVQGALSVGTANSIERAQLEKLYPQIEEEIDDAERRVRAPGSEPVLRGTAGLVTGFLLRSAAVAGWPGLHVRAYKNEPAQHDEEVLPESHSSRIKLLRLERLAPSVLLALFDGVPNVLHLEEPRQGVQFGVRLEEKSPGRWSAFVPARRVTTAGYVDDDGNPVVVADGDPTAPSELAGKMPVRFRSGAAGVLDLSNTAAAFVKQPGTLMSTVSDDPVDGAEFAMQMIRFPYRQVFAQSATDNAAQNDAFKPTITGKAKVQTALFQSTIKDL